MMLTRVRGEFQEFEVDLTLDPDRPEQASVVAAIKTASVNTRDAQRDAHLRSADFFNADAYPEMVFKSTRLERTGKTTARLHGDLTIRAVTRPVTLDVTYLGASKSPWGATNIGFRASTKINREDWGLGWNVALEAGGWLVSKDVTINVEAEFTAQPDQVEEPSVPRRGRETSSIHDPELVAVAAN
jgi:polyisoprenoid-binding protein YceI